MDDNLPYDNSNTIEVYNLCDVLLVSEELLDMHGAPNKESRKI